MIDKIAWIYIKDKKYFVLLVRGKIRIILQEEKEKKEKQMRKLLFEK